jgi:arylsulfatase A-like enzyme
MASPRTTTRAYPAITGTPIEGEQNARQKKPGIAPANAQVSCHDPDVPGKTSLPLAARCLAGRMKETFAGFLTRTDRQVGRLIALQWRRGELDSTLITVTPATA